MKADINVIAKACSVSKTTVSKVFTQKCGISDQTRKRVLDTARKLNYTPKQIIAQNTIAIVIGKDAFTEGPSFRAMLLASVMNKLTDNGCLLKIITSEELKYMIHSYTKLAIVMANGTEAKKVASKLKNRHIPVIAINEQFDGCYSVSSDHAKSIELAVSHLVKNGHEKISLLLDFSKNWGGHERIRGYNNAMNQHGLAPLPYRARFEGEKTVVECLNMAKRDGATALIIEGESIINEAIYMLDIIGIKVPDDLSVISSEMIHRSRWLMPPHTTTDQNIDEMAKKISMIANGILTGELKEPAISMLPSTLIERSSVKNIS